MSRWPTKRLTDLCSIEIGRTPARNNSKYWDSEKLTENVWVSIADMREGVATIVASKEHLSDAGAAITPLVPQGALLLSFKLSLGKLAFAGIPLRTNEAIAALIPNDKRTLEPVFLYWYLRSFDWAMAAKGSEKIKGATLNKAKLKEIPVPLPPLAEQKRIVAVLDEAFEGIAKATANAERNLANARVLLPTLLDELLANAEGAQIFDLEQMVDDDCSLSYGIVQPGDEVEGGLPIVRPTDLGEREIGLDGLKRIDAALAAGYQRTVLKGRDLLLCVRGTTGVVSQAAPELVGANVTRGIVPIRFRKEVLNQELGYFVLQSQGVQRQIRAATYGAALMQINIRDVRKIKVTVPPPNRQRVLLEQLERIANDAGRLEANYARQLELFSEFKASLLHKAFSGQLTGKEAIAA